MLGPAVLNPAQVFAAIEDAAGTARPSDEGVSLDAVSLPERAATLQRFLFTWSANSSEVMEG